MADELGRQERNQILKENSRKPVKITAQGKITIGDDEFLHPIAAGSVKLERRQVGGSSNHYNLLTVTLVVGEVTFEVSPGRDSPVPNEHGQSVKD